MERNATFTGTTAPPKRNEKEKRFRPRQTRKTKIGLWCFVLHSRKETSAHGISFFITEKKDGACPPLRGDLLPIAALHPGRPPPPSTDLCRPGRLLFANCCLD